MMRNGGPGWAWDYAMINGRKLHFRRNDTVSADPPIVHLHGFALSGSYLLPTAKILSGRGLNIVPDLPGYGRSPHPRTAPLDIPALAQCVVDLMDALNLPQVTLLGNSMGCPIALEVAHLAPSRVGRLILVSPAGGKHNQPLVRALAQLLQDGPREKLSMFSTLIPDYLRFGPINMLRLFKDMTRFPSLDRLLHVPVPTLAVLGDRDPLMPPPREVHDVAVRASENVMVAVISGAAHSINYSHPGELAHAVGQWLDNEKITDDPDEAGRTWVPQL